MKSTASWVILWVKFSESNGCSTTSWPFIRTQLKHGTTTMNPTISAASATNKASSVAIRRRLMVTIPTKWNKAAVAQTVAIVPYGRYFWIWNTVPCPGRQSRKLVKGMPKKCLKPWALGWWQWSSPLSQLSPRCHFPEKHILKTWPGGKMLYITEKINKEPECWTGQ